MIMIHRESERKLHDGSKKKLLFNRRLFELSISACQQQLQFSAECPPHLFTLCQTENENFVQYFCSTQEKRGRTDECKRLCMFGHCSLIHYLYSLCLDSCCLHSLQKNNLFVLIQSNSNEVVQFLCDFSHVLFLS